MAMTMKVAMHERHMVRKYLDKPIPADIVETLNDRIRKLNNDHGIEMKLITEDYMVGRWHIQSWYSIAGFT